MKTGIVVLTTCGLLFCSSAGAYDEERAKNNFSHELVECAVYFSITAEGSRRNGSARTAETLTRVSDALLVVAAKYSNDETVLARQQLALEEQVKMMHGDYANLSVLIARYKDVCNEAAEQPQSRLEYWRKKT